MNDDETTRLEGMLENLILSLDAHTEALDLHAEAANILAEAVRDLCRLLREQREWQPVVPTPTGSTPTRSPKSYKLPTNFKPLLSEEEVAMLAAKHGPQIGEGYGPAWKELPEFHGKQYDSLLDLFEGEEEEAHDTT